MEAIKRTFKTNFVTGLFITVPVVITLFAVVGLFRFMDGLMRPALDELLGKSIPGLGFLATLLLVFLVGIIATNAIGQRIIRFGERLLLRIPIFRNIYSAVKQLVNAFNPAQQGSFKRFVMVEYPRAGSFSFGFLTDECLLRQEEGMEERFHAVYIPTNNLYLGEVVLFRAEEVADTGLSIEEGIRLILSGGTATPPVLQRRAVVPPPGVEVLKS
ncbi:MAG: DUF502 domain-containing protein [Nitrospirae bacterium]|nr:DUF502 domain-containing protein [Nitrospirota bacterium]